MGSFFFKFAEVRTEACIVFVLTAGNTRGRTQGVLDVKVLGVTKITLRWEEQT
jgi:hypothetical protein